MKKLLAIGLSLASLALGAAQSKVVDGVTWYYETYSEYDYSTYEYTTVAQIVKGANAYTGDLVMPSSIDGFPVRRIGSSAFKDCARMTSLVLPTTVTSIEYDAFWNCTGLKSMTIPDSVTYMSSYVFEGCAGLESVVLPSGLTRIEYGTFIRCSSLKSVTIPSGVTEICENAFNGCSSLSSVSIPALVTQISENAFAGCTSVESYFVDPANTSYKVTNGCLVSSDETTLLGVPCGIADLVIPDGIVSLSSFTFEGNTNLVSVVIPGSVMTIGYNMFRDCTALQSVTLGEGVEVLESQVFYNCSALRSVELPSTLTSIGSYCFYNCKNLSSPIAIPEGVTEIPYDCFYGCESLETVTLPLTLQSIGGYAFYNCKKLSSPILLPEGLTTLDYDCFNGCESIKSVTLPSTLRTIGSYAFSNCKSLERADIPDGVTRMDYGAFYYCENLTGVKIPSGLEVIPEYAFYGCRKITSIVIPDGVKRIEAYAFAECSLSGEITVPASVEYIGNYGLGYTWGDNRVNSVKFLGAPPKGIGDSGLLDSYVKKSYLREYGAAWQAVIGLDDFTGYQQPNRPAVTIVSAAVRPEDPTVMDVVYTVASTKATVKVRALAFQDGVRSFAKVIRPANFIEGTAANVGDAIAANVEHTLTWKVSSDWQTDLAKVKFEVMAVEDNLLPFELVTIPANTNYSKLQASWNSISESQYLDALFWLYADNDSGMVLENGVLKKADTGSVLAEGTTVSPNDGYYYWYDDAGNYHYTYDGAAAPRYVFEKMGFRQLEGDELEYVKEETRYDLNPDGFRQYAVREVR